LWRRPRPKLGCGANERKEQKRKKERKNLMFLSFLGKDLFSPEKEERN
jgi:hypothetical protein